MLSIEECRRHLGNPDLPDEQVACLRDALHQFARLCIEEYLRENRMKTPPEGR